ncbi:MAG TPA: caspase family protein [Xanthobacteraceae bacterium]|nr:caspase family protein [Xanthobacteraceae bacterium]
MVSAAAAAIAAFLALAAPARAQDKVALIVGNGTYQNVPVLPNPPHDAADVAAAFARLGFSVQVVTNASYEDMRRALLKFSGQARNAQMAVVFFAGHGMEMDGDNWLIPVDAELKTDLDVDQEAISLHSVMLMVSVASKLGLVVLDACRNNPFLGKMKRTIVTRSLSRGLSRIEPTNNVLVAYSAKDGTTAADGNGRNSPFTAAFLKYLEMPGLEVNFLFRDVRDDVIAATGGEQQPFVYGSLSKEAIYFKAPPVAPAPPAADAADAAAWSLLKETTDGAALKRFVAQYPNSPQRKDAEARIAALEEAAATKPVPPRPDEVTWELLKETTDEAALKRFVAQYPNSPLRKDAEARIAALKAAEAAKPVPPRPDEVTWELLKETTDEAALKRFVAQYLNSPLRKDAEARIAALKAAEAAKPVPPRPDEVTWLLLKDTTDDAALKRFMTQYPNSPLRKDAEARIAALAAARAAEPVPPQPEQIAWAMVKDSKDPDQLRRFIQQFPNSTQRPDAEQRIAALSTVATNTSDPHELSRSLQFELKRVGCFTGTVNGEFDDATKAALHGFNKQAATNLPDEASADTIKAVRAINKRVCPLTCGAGEHAEGEQCVANAPSPKRAEAAAPAREHETIRPTPRAAPAVPRGNGKCFSFQGRQFCE